MDARLADDLDLDSIDAVDLTVRLQELTSRKFSPEEFKSVWTVGDVVERVHELLRP
jgi:acyl carrier protein